MGQGLDRRGSALVVALAAAALASSATASAAIPHLPGIDPARMVQIPACAAKLAPAAARCQTLLLRPAAHPDASAAGAPVGYGPADLQSAYGLATPAATLGANQLIALVDAYDDPNAESDLATYRAHFGLPPCTTANGCFRKVSQDGGTNDLPATPPIGDDWAAEEALDLDAASAICPLCHLVLVEATSDSSPTDLVVAANEAAALGATVISNSYGINEQANEASFASSYNHPGIAEVAASGDAGYGTYAQQQRQCGTLSILALSCPGPEFPSVFSDVVGVGGTSLTRNANGTWSERVWNNNAGAGGSGCSQFIPKPAWQTDRGCGGRTSADLAAVADPNTGLAVYNTFNDGGDNIGGSWQVAGGTSASAPIIGAYAALLQSAGIPFGENGAQWAYAQTPSVFNDVTQGANGNCSPAYLCTAGPGYDGPTGLGTPNGSLLAPAVTTGTARTSATGALALTGTVLAHGTASVATFQYGTTSGYGANTASAAIPAGSTGPTPVSATVDGLAPRTLVHYRLVASNSFGSGAGGDATIEVPVRLALAIVTARSHSGGLRVRVRVACTGTEACVGTLALTVPGRTLGRAGFSIPAGQSSTLSVRLYRSGQALIRRHRRGHVGVLASAIAGTAHAQRRLSIAVL